MPRTEGGIQGGGGKPCGPIISTTATIATNWQDGTRTTCSDQRPKVTRAQGWLSKITTRTPYGTIRGYLDAWP